MINKKISTVIRVIINLFWVYYIFKETGFFTASFALMVSVYIELDTHKNDLRSKYFDEEEKWRENVMDLVKKMTNEE